MERRNPNVVSNPITSPYQDFVQNTTLVGVQHFLRQKSVIWLVAYMVCVGMSIFQSWSITVTFFEQKTFQTTQVTSATQMPFPSVTVCSNTVLREDFNFSKVPDFNVSAHEQMLESCTDSKRLMQWENIIRFNKMAVVRYLRTISNEDRMKLGIDLQSYVKLCKFGQKVCNFSDPRTIYIFNSPFYGNCFTFNPAFDNDAAILSDMDDNLLLKLRITPSGYWLVPRLKAKAAVLAHRPGTAPIMNVPEVEDVFGGQEAELSLVLSEMTAYKKVLKGSVPSCVDSDDLAYKQRSRYYTAQSPYRYSLEACMKSCKQDWTGKECGTMDSYLPLQSDEYESVVKVNYSVECELQQQLDMEVCDCPIPCRRLRYTTIRDSNELHNINCYQSRVTKKAEKTEKNKCEEDDTNNYQTEAVIIVRFRSNIYEKIQEELACKLSEFLGILGGNMSLWIGLCVISLLELVELVIKLIFSAAEIPKKPLKHNPGAFQVRNTSKTFKKEMNNERSRTHATSS